MPERDANQLAADVRTPEQEAWIRERFKPDGLLRLAQANRQYADDHGYYLPDVAALALIETARAVAAEAALADMRQALSMCGDLLFGTWDDHEAKRQAYIEAEAAARRALAAADKEPA